jgi:hypothetical protein
MRSFSANSKPNSTYCVEPNAIWNNALAWESLNGDSRSESAIDTSPRRIDNRFSVESRPRWTEPANGLSDLRPAVGFSMPSSKHPDSARNPQDVTKFFAPCRWGSPVRGKPCRSLGKTRAAAGTIQVAMANRAEYYARGSQGRGSARLNLPTMRLLSESLLEHTVTAASDPS